MKIVDQATFFTKRNKTILIPVATVVAVDASLSKLIANIFFSQGFYFFFSMNRIPMYSKKSYTLHTSICYTSTYRQKVEITIPLLKRIKKCNKMSY